MAKSKKTKRFQLDDGRYVTFNSDTFIYEVNKKAREINRQNGKSRGGQAEVLRNLAEKLRPYNPESEVRVVKNWYYKCNGPDQIEDIYSIADFFECEDMNVFLKEAKEENKVNTTVETVKVNIDHNHIISAMELMKEKEIAYDLYSKFVDLMGAYVQADLDIWFECDTGTPGWENAVKSLPARFPMELAVRKASVFLTRDTITKAYNLLEKMYGPPCNDWDEPSRFESFDCFIMQRENLYKEYLEENGITKETAQYVRDDDWDDFILDLNRAWWWELDEVFEDYLRN